MLRPSREASLFGTYRRGIERSGLPDLKSPPALAGPARFSSFPSVSYPMLLWRSRPGCHGKADAALLRGLSVAAVGFPLYGICSSWKKASGILATSTLSSKLQFQSSVIL